MQLLASITIALSAVLATMPSAEGATFCDLIRCTKEVVPVCGSNGVTYDNACMFQIAKCNNDKLMIVTKGKCASATPKPTPTPTPTPIATLATVAPLPSSTPAPSPVKVCEIMCLDSFQPVCGSDGVTYTNRCKLQLANCNNQHSGATPAATAITIASEGECGNADGGEDDGVVTIGPITEEPRANSSTDSTRHPPAVKPTEPATLCEMECIMSVEPVCGSDGVTYNNACELRRASCKTTLVAITQVSEGECATVSAQPAATPATTPQPKCAQMCPADYSPVCGNDGKTYGNKCRFNVAKCTQGITTMAIASEGECATTPLAAAVPVASESCKRACSRIYKPVCGSDGVTYSNQCGFQIAKCTKRIATMSFSDGACATDAQQK